MIVTIFGDVEWKNSRGLWEFLLAHDLKHQALAQIVETKAGVTLPAFLLSDGIDDNWILLHYQQHISLAQQVVQSVDSSIYDLLYDPMADEQSFYDWHDIHNQIHQQIDQTLGISGT